MSDLNRDDLFLLLQSYENTVKSNQTLLEQQKRLIDNHTELLKQIGDNTIENIKSHSNLKAKIIIATTGIGGIVISLIALLERVWTRTSSIITLLEEIAKHSGVSP